MTILIRKCGKCGKDQRIDSYIKNVYAEDGLDMWCSPCRKKYVFNQISLVRYLTANLRPFNEKLFEDSKLKAEKNALKENPNKKITPELLDDMERKACGLYLRQQNLAYNLGQKGIENKPVNNLDTNPNLILKWGEKWNDLDYIHLENFEAGMKKDFTVVTTSHKDYLKKICIISLKMDKSLEENDLNGFQMLSRQYDTLMKSACFTANQRNATDETGGLSTFSDFFRLIEEEGFIPKYATEDQDIVDKTITYMSDYLKKLIRNDPQLVTDIEMLEDEDEIFEDTEECDILDEN